MIHIGTSGYSYPYWKNRFYPAKLPAAQWLAYYASQFSTVELNSSFYRFPNVAHLKKAASQTPDNFSFSVKANKIITHTLRMEAVGDQISEFMDIIQEGLGTKLACILYQMPPSYSYSDQRLDNIIHYLAADNRNVIEFRHTSWWQEKVYEQLNRHRIHFCSVSYPGLPEDTIITGELLYRRMHGVPKLFQSFYSEEALWQLHKQLPDSRTGFVYFNNTLFEAGYTNARLLAQYQQQ